MWDSQHFPPTSCRSVHHKFGEFVGNKAFEPFAFHSDQTRIAIVLLLLGENIVAAILLQPGLIFENMRCAVSVVVAELVVRGRPVSNGFG